MQKYSEAVRLFNMGQPEAARLVCIDALRERPDIPQLWSLLGAACTVTDRVEEAMVSFNKALKINPLHSQTLFLKGNLYRKLGDIHQAIDSYKKSLQANHGLLDAWMGLGLAYDEVGDVEEAIRSFQALLKKNPDQYLAWFNLGNALQKIEKFNEAVGCYDHALAISPEFQDALFNKANAFLAMGYLPDSIACYKKLIECCPMHESGLVNLGVALRRSGYLLDSVEQLNKALVVNQNNCSALITLGNVYSDMKDHRKALEAFDAAILIDSRNADAYFNKGNVLYGNKKVDLALIQFQEALALNPSNPHFLGALLGAQCAVWDFNSIENAWNDLMELWGEGQLVPIDMVLQLSDSPQIHYQCAVNHAQDLIKRINIKPSAFANGSHPKTGRRLKIGYLSPDFGEHPVGMSIVEVIELHDINNFEIFCLSLSEHPKGTVLDRLKNNVEHFIGMSALDSLTLVEQINGLNLDILVDLAGYTTGSRPEVMAARVAPIQISFLGFASTMGASWIDYLIADRYVIPEDAVTAYAERVVQMEHSFFPTDTKTLPPVLSTDRRQQGLPESAFVFCCFNSAQRITPKIMQAWLEVLRSVDNSVLWLQRPLDVAITNMQAFALQNGVDPSRLVFAKFADSRTDHLSRHRLADLYLDTFPYNSHSTARDALWMGLPIVTYSGRSFASRVAGSMLTTLGLPELVTHDFHAYIHTAIAIAQNADKLSDIKIKLEYQVKHSALFNMPLFVNNLELSYRSMVERNVAGLVPTHMAISGGEAIWH